MRREKRLSRVFDREAALRALDSLFSRRACSAFQTMTDCALLVEVRPSYALFRHCERSEAIQETPRFLGCFVAALLAMTARQPSLSANSRKSIRRLGEANHPGALTRGDRRCATSIRWPVRFIAQISCPDLGAATIGIFATVRMSRSRAPPPVLEKLCPPRPILSA